MRAETAVILQILTIFHLFVYGNSIRTKDKMYEAVEGSKACFRRLNATHQIGCTSRRGGSTGVIHFCENQADLDFILKNGTAGPYVPVIPTALFTRPNVDVLRRSVKISGLLLYVDDEKLTSFSHDNQCPNPLSSLKDSCGQGKPIWNLAGTGLLFEDIPFPVFYVEDQNNVATARKCFRKHNNFSFDSQRDRSLCSLQLSSFMYASTNTPTCIRRSNAVTNLNPVKYCDPLGDRNVWASLFPLAKLPALTELATTAGYIVISARLDTTSMIDKTSGAVSPITGLVALLSTAKLLKAMLPGDDDDDTDASTYDRNVLFVVFNGETYDYIGSQRFLYEMLQGNFPARPSENPALPTIGVEDIDLFIELSQLSRSSAIYAHYLSSSDKIDSFMAALGKNRGSLRVEQSLGTLPPASLHTFLKNDTDIAGIVLTDHKAAYVNSFYNSIYDNASNIDYRYYNGSGVEIPTGSIQKHVAEVAEMVAKSVYGRITGLDYAGKETADVVLVDELFHCYLEDSNCRVHQAVQKIKLQGQPLSLYVGVEIVANFITSHVGLTLAWLTGDVVGEGNANCTNDPRNNAVKYYNMSASLDDLNTTKCFRATMNLTDAISPAFIIKDYDWSSGQYSTWTESTWGSIKIQIFLKPSAAHENMTMAIGSMVLILSFLFVYFIKSRSEILFAPPLPTLAPTNC